MHDPHSTESRPLPQESGAPRRPFTRADPPQVEFHIEYVTGELGEELHRRQAEVVMEVLQWAARQQHSEAPPLSE